MASQESLIPKHGGYRNLKSFKIARLIYDITVWFCERYVERRSRTHDQMVQAARSGVQNIAEGSMASATSKKTELKLTGVARASLEELFLDYEDFLRQRGLAQWEPEDPPLKRFKARRCSTLDEVLSWAEAEERLLQADKHGRTGTDTGACEANGRGNAVSNLSARAPGRPDCAHNSQSVPVRVSPCPSVTTAQLVANAALSLLNLCLYFLKRQLASQAATFEEEGGFTERLYRVRSRTRKRWP